MYISLIGREKEQAILQDALLSAEAEFVAVIGRRRVGKTFLIKTAYKDFISALLTSHSFTILPTQFPWRVRTDT